MRLILLMILVASCSSGSGYSSMQCNKHYHHFARNMTIQQRQALLRQVHFRCLDGLKPEKHWDGLDRKYKIDRNRRL